uniref:SFRICE_014454 n=1 Tax=Spodoptera frugiperda TaxID=7108 RepID=A0A2H1V4R4_SPOFR
MLKGGGGLELIRLCYFGNLFVLLFLCKTEKIINTTTSRLLSLEVGVIQCTPTFHHFCYKLHVMGGEPIVIYWAQIQTPNTLPYPGIEPEIPCSAVALATTQPTRQSVVLRQVFVNDIKQKNVAKHAYVSSTAYKWPLMTKASHGEDLCIIHHACSMFPHDVFVNRLSVESK